MSHYCPNATTKRMKPVEDPKRAETRRMPAVESNRNITPDTDQAKPDRHISLWWLPH